MSSSKEDLARKGRDFKELKSTLGTPGWKIVQRLLTEEFNDAMDQLTNPNSAEQASEARGTIKFIKKFTETLDSEMGFGEKAQKDYIKKHVNPPKGQEPE